jgi:hypothetical protein
LHLQQLATQIASLFHVIVDSFVLRWVEQAWLLPSLALLWEWQVELVCLSHQMRWVEQVWLLPSLALLWEWQVELVCLSHQMRVLGEEGEILLVQGLEAELVQSEGAVE